MKDAPQMPELPILSVVALIQDLPEHRLVRGQVGTIVDRWKPGVYEVEFSDESGKTYALIALTSDQVLRLHHEPMHLAT
jgi:hypothetical protein